MPIYEYQCQACEERLETIQSISDPPLTTCPECGGELRKLLSAPAFQFKGSGWYVTDYARQGNGKKKGDGESADSGKGSDSGASKESAKAASGSEKSTDKKSAKSAAG